jgi:hypothetical protein
MISVWFSSAIDKNGHAANYTSLTDATRAQVDFPLTVPPCDQQIVRVLRYQAGA